MPIPPSLFKSERLILWVPVLLMLGAGAYFALPEEPGGFAGVRVLTGATVLLALSWRWRLRWAMLPLFVVALGFTAAQFRTQQVATPLVAEELRQREVTGRIADIIVTETGAKLVLAAPAIEGVDKPPRRVRVSLKRYDPAWQVGDTVRMTATLYPLPRPAMPGAYDFARYFYFDDIGAVGFAFKPPEVIQPAGASAFSEWLKGVRHRIADDMRARISGGAGAIAAALTVGEQGAIAEEDNEAMRVAGIYHVVSISGLHMALAAGIVFFVVRLLLVLYPPLGYRLPVKKISAAFALAAAFIYLLLAGSPIPAQRSFIMVAFVLVAVMLDRRGISVYSLAWAAVFILLLFPESMMGASFQMSFAATLAMVAFYENFGRTVYRANASWAARAGYAMLGILATSLVATLATAPFVITHFNRFSTFGLLTNALVIPLASFVIMPGVILSLLLFPLGLQGIGYFLQEWGVRTMMAISQYVAAFPYASVPLPSLTEWGFLLAVGGLLWLCLMQGRVRLLGILAIAIGMSTSALHRAPDVLIGDDARQVMVRLSDGEWGMLKGGSKAFTTEIWLRANAAEAALTPKQAAAVDTGVACDRELCRYERDGIRLMVLRKWEALPRACAENSDVLVVWRYVKPEECAGAALLIERGALEQFGAHALYFDNGTIHAERSVRPRERLRPWQVKRRDAYNDDADAE